MSVLTRMVCAVVATTVMIAGFTGQSPAHEFELVDVSILDTNLGRANDAEDVPGEPKHFKGKDSCCCVGCCCDDPCARWTFYGGFLMMQRSQPSDALLFSSAVNANETFNANQFNFDYEPGFEVGAIKHNILPCFICGLDLEARFFMIDGWSDTQNFQTTGTSPLDDTIIHTDPIAVLNGPRNIVSRYDSELTSFELNLRRRSCLLPRVRWIAGVRALELDEGLYTTFDQTVPEGPGLPLTTSTYTVTTRNRLFGFQLGAEVDLLNHCCWCLRGFGKAGIYNNESGHDGLLTCCPGLEPTLPLHDRSSRTSGVAELGLSFRYCWCECVTLRADYRTMWIDGVALASEQVAVSNFNPAPVGENGIDTSGSVFYHGLNVGLEYRF